MSLTLAQATALFGMSSRRGLADPPGVDRRTRAAHEERRPLRPPHRLDVEDRARRVTRPQIRDLQTEGAAGFESAPSCA
jgi:hypothetical protein